MSSRLSISSSKTGNYGSRFRFAHEGLTVRKTDFGSAVPPGIPTGRSFSRKGAALTEAIDSRISYPIFPSLRAERAPVRVPPGEPLQAFRLFCGDMDGGIAQFLAFHHHLDESDARHIFVILSLGLLQLFAAQPCARQVDLLLDGS